MVQDQDHTSKIKIIPVQKQNGSKDCGLFAIAMMTSMSLIHNDVL